MNSLNDNIKIYSMKNVQLNIIILSLFSKYTSMKIERVLKMRNNARYSAQVWLSPRMCTI